MKQSRRIVDDVLPSGARRQRLVNGIVLRCACHCQSGTAAACVGIPAVFQYGDFMEIPVGVSAVMRWVWELEFDPHDRPAVTTRFSLRRDTTAISCSHKMVTSVE